MHIIYYSHAHNTERFVHRHLWSALTSNLELPVPELPIRLVRAFAKKGPQSELIGFSFPTGDPGRTTDTPAVEPNKLFIPPRETVLFVTPTYGKFNHEIHRAENFTPKVMQQVYEWYDGSRHPSDTEYRTFVAVGGNRTFGKDFCFQTHGPRNARKVGQFELSGSETEAEVISKNVVAALSDYPH